jgi:16S rRNA (guanine527-N7)-methyltransferase
MEKLIAGAQKLGLSLTKEQVTLFQTYYEELIRWNRRVNLTAIVDYEEVQIKHFLDSLTIAPLIGNMSGRLLDVGTGAGFPGVPLKIIFPDIAVTLVESVKKKAAFLDHLVDCLGLDSVEVIAERAETLAHDERHRERFDVAVSRGVADLATLAEITLPFCVVGGIAVAMKKGDIEDEVSGASKAIDVLGGRLREVRPVELAEFAGEARSLVVIEKVSSTPERYPRRPGIPKKRPL